MHCPTNSSHDQSLKALLTNYFLASLEKRLLGIVSDIYAFACSKQALILNSTWPKHDLKVFPLSGEHIRREEIYETAGV